MWQNALLDLIGSPILTVSQAGAVSAAVHYDPYGTPRPGSSAAVGIGYAGEYRDGTGLVNLRARSYDPLLAPFSSAATRSPASPRRRKPATATRMRSPTRCATRIRRATSCRLSYTTRAWPSRSR